MKSLSKSKSWKSRVALIACLLVVFFAGDRIFGAVLEQGTRMSKARLPKAYTGRLKGDAWILGNSRGAKSFELQLLGKANGVAPINLSLNGLRPSMLHALANDSLDLNTPPKLVWIEVSYLKTVWNEASAGEFLPYVSHGESTQAVLSQKLPKQTTAAKLFQLRKFGGQQYFRSLLFLRRSDQKEMMRKTISDAAVAAIKARENEPFETSKSTLDELKNVIDRFASASTEVRLVLAPYLPEYRAKITNLDGWLQSIESHVDRPIVDASAAVTDQAMFADHVHLNEKGQLAFTEWLTQR